MDAAYAAAHERFVSGHNGTSPGEVLLVCSIAPLSVLLFNLAVPWIFPARNFADGTYWNAILKLFLDWLLLEGPTLLVLSSCSEMVQSVLFVVAVTAVALSVFSFCEFLYLRRDSPCLKEALNELVFPPRRGHLVFVTYMRGFLLLTTSVAILAVDFPVFPRRFAKTETFGFSLMDVGVGMFVFVNGLTSSDQKLNYQNGYPARGRLRRVWRRLLGASPLVALGVVRLVAVKASGYHQHISEYGLHWNFFFTLAAVQMFGSLLSGLCGSGALASVLLTMGTGAGQEALLQLFQSRSFIRSASPSRLDFFSSNHEGLVSLSGYLCLYFAGLSFGTFVFRTRLRIKDLFVLLAQLLLMTLLSGCLLILLCFKFELPSRRLANSSYVVWIVSLSSLHLSAFLFVEILVHLGAAFRFPLYSYTVNPFGQLEPSLVWWVNVRGLWFFLLANILTGLVNLVLPTISLQPSHSTLILALYSLLLAVIISLGKGSSESYHRTR